MDNLNLDGIEVTGALAPGYSDILTPEALLFVAKLHREFATNRAVLLEKRVARQAEIDAGNWPDFLSATRPLRQDSSWKVAPIPHDLQKRQVEITGPVERKMMINALNSGADVFMADFEDSNSPTWHNVVQGQINLCDAVDRTITYPHPDGKPYKLNEEIATLLVRPRGWHLNEKHVLVDGKPISASIFDFGLYFFHNAQKLMAKNTAPYFYLPKLEGHLEARLWNEVFLMAQDALGIPGSTIKATVLIENILAVFEMEEILYELREHIAGLNAGRWDYIFSIIRKFRNQAECVLPDRSQVSMTVPFMRAYTELLVQTCHRRGAHAIGGMAANIPTRRNPEVNEIALTKVREDKERESQDGFDGTWVAHPDLVPLAKRVFEQTLGDRLHQKERVREEVQIAAPDLLDFTVRNGKITEEGLRQNLSVALQYLEAWLRGTGCVPIYNLMEDAATAEISRAQVWQWIHHNHSTLADGRKVSKKLYQSLVPEELEKIKNLVGAEAFNQGKYELARQIFDELVIEKTFTEFLTLIAYNHLN
ncbi:MAG: malate synthase A [bacterium]